MNQASLVEYPEHATPAALWRYYDDLRTVGKTEYSALMAVLHAAGVDGA